MGGDNRRLPHQQFNWQIPNLSPLGAPPLDIGQQNPISAGIYPGINMTPMSGALPVYASSKVPHSWVGQANEPHGWFYCLPRFRQSFTPALNQSIAEGRLPTNPYESCREAIALNAGSGCVQKKFAADDKSRDQTTLIFSSGIGTPVQCLSSWGPKPSKLNGEDIGINGGLNYFSGPIQTDEINENLGTDVQSEMHEDTEELNALLYSDNTSEYTEDGEVTSTGHSPCTMTAHDKKDWLEGSIEEVASSAWPTKKRKQLDTVYDDAPSVMDTASSMNRNRRFKCEDDAESSSANGNNAGSRKMCSFSSTKRMKKERIRETVNILQNIIPGASGKDAIVVIDETIHYLKSLKLRAMALGLDAL